METKNSNPIKKTSFLGRIFLLIIFVAFLFVGLIIGYGFRQYKETGGISTTETDNFETVVVPEQSDKEKEENISAGIVTSPDKDFSIYVGEKMIGKVVISMGKNSDATASYSFCYKLTDMGYESGMCPKGQSPLFTINKYTKAQFDVMLGTPFFEATADEGYRTEGGYYYTLSHPNGDLPDEIFSNLPESNWGEYYMTVLDSLNNPTYN